MVESDKLRLPDVLASGGCIRNAWMTIGDPYLGEIVAASGEFTAVTLDMQHGLIGLPTAIECVRSIQAYDCCALVRLPQLDEALIGILLDAAIDGLILPQTDSVSDATRFIAACRYPPKGTRSFGPTRARLIKQQARGFVTFCMIETVAGLESVNEIANVDGLDGLFVGPGDLGFSLGIGPAQDRQEPEFINAVSAIKDAARQGGKALGIHANSATYAAEKAVDGFQLVTTWVDVVSLKQSIAESANNWRNSIGNRVEPG